MPAGSPRPEQRRAPIQPTERPRGAYRDSAVTNGRPGLAADCGMIINGPPMPFHHLTAPSILRDLCLRDSGGGSQSGIRARRRPPRVSRSRRAEAEMKRHRAGGSLLEQVNDYNQRVPQEAFHIRVQDEGSYNGVLRFQLEYGENRFVKAVRVKNDTPASELTATLLEKFNVSSSAVSDKVRVSLVQITTEGEHELSETECPLQNVLELDSLPTFVLRISELLADGRNHVQSPSDPPSGSPNAKGRSGSSLAKWLLKKPFAVKLMNTDIAAHLSLRRKADQPSDSETRFYGTIGRRQHGKKAQSAMSPLQEGHDDTDGSSERPQLKPSRSLENLADIRFRSDARDRRQAKVTRIKSVTVAKSMSNMLSIDSQEEQLRVHMDAAQFGRSSIDVNVNGNTTAEQIVAQVARGCSLEGDAAVAFADGFALCDVVGRLLEGLWLTDYARPMADDEKPLMLLSLMKPSEGFSRRFEIRPCEALLAHEGAPPHSRLAQPEGRGSESPSTRSATYRAMSTDDIEQRLSLSPSVSSSGRMDTMKFPQNQPYFITVHAYDHENDYVLHPIDEGITFFGSSDEAVSSSLHGHISLRAPDLLPRHCCITWLTSQPPAVTVAPAADDAIVKVNNLPVSAGGIPLKPGDLIAIGKHYVFLFKDPTLKKSRVQHDQTKERTNGSAAASATTDLSSDEHGFSKHPADHANDLRNSLSYSIDCENELVAKIADIMSPDEDGFKLTPAYLYALAVEYSHIAYGEESLQGLIIKISSTLQGEVWESVKALTADTHGSSSNLDPLGSVQSIVPGLQPVLFWMANCSEIWSFLTESLPKYFAESDLPDVDDLAREVCSALEETITYGFQQTVYHLTKAMYPHLDILLTSNPFGDSSPEETSVRDIVRALELIQSMCQENSLPVDITEQLLCYLYFFIGTCLFNAVMESGTERQLCNWDVGVKLRKNLEALEIWAAEHSCQHGTQYLEKIIAVADLLSTSKQFLIQMQWSSLRELFSHLSAAQLNRVLDLYQLGLNKPKPQCWTPTPDDAKRATASDKVMENFDSHPPLSLPNMTTIELWDEVPDKSFYDYLDYINGSFGCSDDGDLSRSAEADEPRDTRANAGSADSHRGDSPKAVLASPGLARRGKQQSSSRSADLLASGSSSGEKHAHGYNPLFKKKGAHKRGDSGSSTSSSIESQPLHREGKQHTLSYSGAIADLGDSADVAWDRQLVMLESLGSKKKNKWGSDEQPWLCNVAKDLNLELSSCHSGKSSTASVTSRSTKNTLAVVPLDSEQNKQVDKRGAALNGGEALQDGFDESELDLLLEEDSTLSESHKAALSAFLKGDTLASLDDDLFVIELDKGHNGLGLGIIDGLYTQHCATGIYIKQLIPNGPAEKDGRLKLGDRILAANGCSLVSADFQSALKIMKEAGSHVRLLVVASPLDVASKIVLPVKSK